MHRPAARLHRAPVRRLQGILLVALLTAGGPALGADPMATTRVLLQSGLLGDVDRAHSLYVEALSGLDVPDDVGPATAVAIRSTFPAAQLRERWLQAVAARLDDPTLAAARDFFGSVPGQTVGAALRRALAGGARNQAGGDAPPSAQVEELVTRMEAEPRDQLLHAYAQGMALWTSRLMAGTTDADGLQKALQDALSSMPRPSRRPEAEALAQLPQLYLEGFSDFAESDAGARFFHAVTESLDEALQQLARGQVGRFVESVSRRYPPAEPLGTP